MSTLESITVFPVEDGGSFSADFENFINKVVSNLGILNEEKAELDENNAFTGSNSFSQKVIATGGINTGKTSVTTTPKTIGADEGFLCVTTSTEDIYFTLPEAANSIGDEKIICLEADGGYDAIISCHEGDTLNYTGNNRVTLDDADDFIRVKGLASGRWLIEQNTGNLSTV